MQLTLSGQLTQFAHVMQSELFPRLEEEVGPINDKRRLFIAACVMIPFQRYLPGGHRTGRPAKSRLALAHAFLAKSIYNFANTRQLIEALKTDVGLRNLCGYRTIAQIPHESSFSRAFAEFALSNLAQCAHEALIRTTHSDRLVGHIARDGSAIEARERFADPAAKAKLKAKAAKKKKKKDGKKKGHHSRQTAAARLAEGTRIEKQLAGQSVEQMLSDIPTACDIGGKKNSKGIHQYWRGYKLHLDVADGQIPISALITSASVHDSQVAIPLMHISSKRVTYLYDLMDSAYDAASIHTASKQLGHVPVIDIHTRAKSKTQLACRVKLQPQMYPAKSERYKTRTMIERVFGRLKDEFGARQIRVRGPSKVMAHLMFGVLALTVDQLLRLSK